MKTSKAQQAKTERAILAAAVDLMTSQGFERTTMKQIARTAGIGDATIYSYFATKEKLVLGWFELAVADALAAFDKTRGLAGFTLQEQFQRLTDALLERMLPDREFVAIARDLARQSPLLLIGDQLPGKAALKARMLILLEQAEERGELPPCGYKSLLAGMGADYQYGVLTYWLQDGSDEFADTTQLVDLSTAIVVLVLKSGVLDKLGELAGFMLRNQMARLLSNGGGLLELLGAARRGLMAQRPGSAA